MKTIINYLNQIMLWNYILVTFRKIRKEKWYSVINITGLAVGLACCILMTLWIKDDMSFDSFHKNGDSIYRVINETSTKGKTTMDARTPYPLGEAMLEKVPGVEYYTHYQGVDRWMVTAGGKSTYSDWLGTADSSFFEIFSFPFVKGNPKTAFSDHNSIVLTETMARKYFGNDEPMGKTVEITENKIPLKVTGIMKDFPDNSHLHFDCIIPSFIFWQFWDGQSGDWNMINFYTYVKLSPNASVSLIEKKIASVMNERIQRSNSIIHLQPLADVHLKSNFEWDLDNYMQGSQATLYIFTLAALGVLLLAMINFTNLSTARSANRAKEIGLRKVCGAKRTDLIGQFLGESLMLAFLALAIALILVIVSIPLVNDLTGKKLSFFDLCSPIMIIGLISYTLITGLLSGGYPAFFLSAFQPTNVLKGDIVAGGGSQAFLRKSLVVAQFSLTLFLVIGSVVVGRQMKFIREKNLGMDTRNVLTVEIAFRDSSSAAAARNILLSNPRIISLTQSDPPRLDQRGMSNVSWEGKNPTDKILFFPVSADAEYIKTFRISMAEGRFFSNDFPSDRNESVVLNETAIRAMGITSPIGKQITIGSEKHSIIGVVKDFHQNSLHRAIEPMIIIGRLNAQMCIRIIPENAKETISFIQTTIKKFAIPIFTQRPLKCEFLDDRIDGFYNSEKKIENILNLFTGIALFTACLGLLGLVSFLVEKRKKEFGIRKILGAPVSSLIWLQGWEFSKWILLSGLVACPFAYYAAVQWLQGFAYHINPGIGIFFSAIFATLVIALLAVGFQLIRAAKANPVDSLKSKQ